MGISVRQATTESTQNRHTGTRNWVVEHKMSGVMPTGPSLVGWRTLIRTYTCTTWADAISVADDLANGRRIDVARVIALSERRV